MLKDRIGHLDYDLVRIHHPDMATARNIPAQVAESRFRLISIAYDRLRDPSGSRGGYTASRRDDEYRREVARRRAAAAAARYQGFGVRDSSGRPMTTNTGPEKLWQRDEGLLFVFGMLVCRCTLLPVPSKETL